MRWAAWRLLDTGVALDGLRHSYRERLKTAIWWVWEALYNIVVAYRYETSEGDYGRHYNGRQRDSC